MAPTLEFLWLDLIHQQDRLGPLQRLEWGVLASDQRS